MVNTHVARDDTCRWCRYWNVTHNQIMTAANERDFRSNVGDATARCHRHAPVAQAHSTIWPQTTSISWCGDFEDWAGGR